MYEVLVSLIIAVFAALLFLNLYFRAKVLKVYGVLARNKVQFGAAHVFNKKKMEAEVLPRYPQFAGEIQTFVSHIRYSIRMATVLIALITLLGAVMMYYR
ncbi:MAG: hypothetical protein ACK4NS_01420 [Saprospiraceae bacterium]